MAKNENLHAARAAKNDEFYTQLSDVERECYKYRSQLAGKRVYLNCDSEQSAFWYHFRELYEVYKLAGLVATNLQGDKLEYDGVTVTRSKITDGDFRSDECMNLLAECDIVITNPPFSLFREYVALIMGSGKQFLVIGTVNAITYKDVFPYIQRGELWLGYNANVNMHFFLPDSYERYKEVIDGRKVGVVPGITWYTNLEVRKRTDKIPLFREYEAEKYPKYDGYEIINIDKTVDIPCNYYGEMGVPITFLTKYNPTQFEILGLANDVRWMGVECYTKIRGVSKYNRIIIRRIDGGASR